MGEALRMATISGAKALGLAEQTGSLKVGKAADLIAVDLGHLELAPIFDPLSTLVFSNRRNVTHVWLDGKCLVSDGNVLTFKPDLEKIEAIIAKIREFRKTLPGMEKPVCAIGLNL